MAGGTWVEVAQGESAESVAYRHGHVVATVWDDPENRALRETRGSPHTLHPGDRLFVPALRPGEAACATSRVHTFRRRGVPSGITLSLGVAGRALADLPYELRVDGATLAGRTGADGGVTVKVMPDAREAVLVVDPDGLALTFDLLPRHLDPVTETTGLQGRLRNLGYHPGEVDGAFTVATLHALQRFQLDQGLPTTGMPDDATREALLRAHGS